MPPTQPIVRAVLAHHLERDVATMYPWLRLEDDLDMTPLELVLVALEIEEIEHARIPFDELAGAETVGDLLTFFARALEVTNERSVAQAEVESGPNVARRPASSSS